MFQIYGYQPSNDRLFFPRQQQSGDGWLRNQVFRIKGEHYTLHDRRGGGTFGSVWSSTKPNGHHAAVKVFDLRQIRDVPPEILVKSFKDEVKMAHRLRDAKSHVVNIFGFDFDPSRHVALLAMELGDETLESRAKQLHSTRNQLAHHDFISSKDRKAIWLQLSQILFVLNQHHIVHRDMKPANLVFFGPILKLVDLGIAQKVVRGYDGDHGTGGTPYFSAPECFQMGARVTPKADIWSGGAILYYLTYGQAPLLKSAHPPAGKSRTRSEVTHDMMNRCLQHHTSQRINHQSLSHHPYTASQSL